MVGSVAVSAPHNNEMQLTGGVPGCARIGARVIIVSPPAADLGVGRTVSPTVRLKNGPIVARYCSSEGHRGCRGGESK